MGVIEVAKCFYAPHKLLALSGAQEQKQNEIFQAVGLPGSTETQNKNSNEFKSSSPTSSHLKYMPVTISANVAVYEYNNPIHLLLDT